MKAFNDNATLPKYLDKHQKAYEAVLIVFWCVIFPMISAICCLLGGKRLFSNRFLTLRIEKTIWALFCFTVFFFLQGLFSQ